MPALPSAQNPFALASCPCGPAFYAPMANTLKKRICYTPRRRAGAAGSGYAPGWARLRPYPPSIFDMFMSTPQPAGRDILLCGCIGSPGGTTRLGPGSPSAYSAECAFCSQSHGIKSGFKDQPAQKSKVLQQLEAGVH